MAVRDGYIEWRGLLKLGRSEEFEFSGKINANAAYRQIEPRSTTKTSPASKTSASID
jgi:hypothetical protein